MNRSRFARGLRFATLRALAGRKHVIGKVLTRYHAIKSPRHKVKHGGDVFLIGQVPGVFHFWFLTADTYV